MAFGDISGGIAAASGGNCSDINLKNGVGDLIYIFNYSEKGILTVDPTNPLKATNLVLESGGARAWVFEQIEGSGKPAVESVQQTYRRLFRHFIDMRAFSHDVEDEKIIQELFCANVCFVVETKTRFFKLYGWDAGVSEAGGSGMNHANPDEVGAWVLNLSSREDDLETQLPYTLDAGDYASTKALVEGLLIPTA